ncbi:MAG: hypothetical protein CMH41_00830 [Micrococcales bacterium]|nr:hypothetical protein [Micrococcales bacterium]
MTGSVGATLTALRLRHRQRHRDWQKSLKDDLAELVALTDQVRVELCLVGGVGLAVRQQSFHRNHSDLDLAVFLSDLPAFLAGFESVGYRLYGAQAGLCISPWHRVDILRAISVDAVMAEPNRYCLRLVRGKKSNSVLYTRQRTDVMDLMTMDISNEGIVLHGYDRVVPHRDFFPLTKFSGSQYVCLPNIRYKSHLPAAWPRQRKDLAAVGLS